MIQQSKEALTGFSCGGERAAVAIQYDPGFSDERPYPETPSDGVSSSGPGDGDGPQTSEGNRYGAAAIG
jgi:hypothetical protein